MHSGRERYGDMMEVLQDDDGYTLLCSNKVLFDAAEEVFDVVTEMTEGEGPLTWQDETLNND